MSSAHTAVGGFSYQHLYSALELLALLDPGCEYASACLEDPERAGIDDITFAPKPDAHAPPLYVQVKWHVDQRDAYSTDTLVAQIDTRRSLLQRLFQGWQKLPRRNHALVWLVSNWTVDQRLGRHIDAEDGRLKDAFFSSKELLLWQRHLQTSTDEAQAFAKALRFRLSFGTFAEIEQRLDDRMGRYGLRIGKNERDVLEKLVSDWIRKSPDQLNENITPERLRKELLRRDLFAPREERLDAALWVHAWAKKKYDGTPTAELDWTAFGFDHAEKTIPAEETWIQTLRPQLLALRKQWLEEGKCALDIRGKMPLSASLLLGSVFACAPGFRLRTEQMTQARSILYRSDVEGSAQKFVVFEDQITDGEDVLIAFAVTGSIHGDREAAEDRKYAVTLLQTQPSARIKRVMTAACERPGHDAISSNADLVALVNHARELLDRAKKSHKAARIHLVLHAPAAFALLLGQRLNALGEIVSYERTKTGLYARAFSLCT